MSGFAWRTLCQNASTVWPERVRPEASTIVPLMISGTRSPSSSNSDSTAKIAAFALSVSKIVSMSRRSAPPSTRPAADVAVGGLELLPAHAACRGVADIRAHRRGPVGRAERPGHVARAARIRAFRGVGGVPRETRGGDVQLATSSGSKP